MPQNNNDDTTHVRVTIAGRGYRMACTVGDEARIEALAASVDKRIGELAAIFGSIDDLRLTVMTAFSIADDLAAANRRITEHEAEIIQLKEQITAGKEREIAQEAEFSAAINTIAERVENVTADLTPTLQA